MITLTLLLILAFQPALSQPQESTRSDQPPKQPSENQQSAQPPIPPIHVTVAPAQKSPEEAETERRDRQREIAIQEQIAQFTGLLLMVGIAQAVAAIAAVIAAFKAASAARRSADVADDQRQTLIKQQQTIDQQAGYMRDGLDHAKASADAASAQAQLARQQLVGTLGAIITANAQLSPIGELNVHFYNGGGVTAKNLRGSIAISRIQVPSLSTIEMPTVYEVTQVALGKESAASFTYRVDTNWIPAWKSDEHGDAWDKFVINPQTVKIEVLFSYENGFGDSMEGQKLSQVHLPRWNIKTKRGSTGGGSAFVNTDTVAFTWENVNIRKQEEAQGIYRDF